MSRMLTFQTGGPSIQAVFCSVRDRIVRQINALGRQNFIEYLGEGQGFGEIDLFLEHDIYDYFAFAKTEVKLLSVSRHFFIEDLCKELCASQQNYFQHASDICRGSR